MTYEPFTHRLLRLSSTASDIDRRRTRSNKDVQGRTRSNTVELSRPHVWGDLQGDNQKVTSKTVNVPEVFALYPVMRTITKHFEASIKNKERLDECMKILELTPLHLISWCQTRMAHFLTACTVFDTNLPALYDAMSTLDIRVEEREQLFTATSIYVLKVVSSLEPLFVQTYLRAADRSNLLVSQSFHIANKLAIKLEEESLETQSADSFAESLVVSK